MIFFQMVLQTMVSQLSCNYPIVVNLLWTYGLFVLHCFELMLQNFTAARPGGKFRPKAKLKPRKESSASVQSIQSTQSVTIAENELTETLRTEKASENNADDFVGVTLFDDKRSSGLMNHSSEHLAARESMGPIVSLHSEAIMGDDGDWNSCFGKSEGEVNFFLFTFKFLVSVYWFNLILRTVTFRMGTYSLGWEYLMVFFLNLQLLQVSMDPFYVLCLLHLTYFS